jgi:alkylhydroperoxidase family enzyme
MAKLLHEIEWGSPLLPPQKDGNYEEELGERMSPWLGAAVRSLNDPQKISFISVKLFGVVYFVTCQENSCRYCYGEARALMKMWGYSEKQIQDLEHEANLASVSTRLVVEFARKLAHANPVPAKKERENLIKEGLRTEEIAEISAVVAKACFANRLATFIALPPNREMERIPESFLGRISAAMLRRKISPKRTAPPEKVDTGPCAEIIETAGRSHIAVWLRSITDGWLASEVIPRRSKLLMFAVIARQLGSLLCEREAVDNLVDEGLSQTETEGVLSTLSSSLLTPMEEKLLRWTRETVWYEPKSIQDSTRNLLAEAGAETTLEAVGTAAVCNSLARLSLVNQ